MNVEVEAEELVRRLRENGSYDKAQAYAVILEMPDVSPLIRTLAQRRFEELVDAVFPPKPKFRWVNGAKVAVK
jgi:hypothetical protein